LSLVLEQRRNKTLEETRGENRGAKAIGEESIFIVWPKRFVYACAVKIVDAWHLVSSALAFLSPRNLPWRGLVWKSGGQTLGRIREDKRWLNAARPPPCTQLRGGCSREGKERADCVWMIGG
jgi:hypothetical protein